MESKSIAEIIEARRGAWFVDEVGELLGISKSEMYRMARVGEIPKMKMGKKLRFDPRELAKWVRERST